MTTAMFIITSNNKTPQSTSGVHLRGRNNGGLYCSLRADLCLNAIVSQQSWEEPVQNYVTLPRISEQPKKVIIIIGDLKKALGGFLSL